MSEIERILEMQKKKAQGMYLNEYSYTKKHRLAEYSFPGGYPLYYVDNEHNVLCAKCASRERYSTVAIEACVNWEYKYYCEECGQRIESAYGVDE